MEKWSHHSLQVEQAYRQSGFSQILSSLTKKFCLHLHRLDHMASASRIKKKRLLFKPFHIMITDIYILPNLHTQTLVHTL